MVTVSKYPQQQVVRVVMAFCCDFLGKSVNLFADFVICFLDTSQDLVLSFTWDLSIPEWQLLEMNGKNETYKIPLLSKKSNKCSLLEHSKPDYHLHAQLLWGFLGLRIWYKIVHYQWCMFSMSKIECRPPPS